MITDLHFENFRGFADLRLEGLKRVNLIVGRNNSGKTSLLEGIIIATNPERLRTMHHVLRNHFGNEGQRYYRWLIRDRDGAKEALLEVKNPDGDSRMVLDRRQGQNPNRSPANWTHVAKYPYFQAWKARTSHQVSIRVLPIQQLQPPDLVKLFAQAVKKKGGEERLEKLLQTVDDRIQKIRVEPAEDGNHLMVDLGLSEMLPLPQVGQGVYRLVAIFSELIGEQPRLCIVDELENGIHHSLLEQIWTGLAVVSEELNIQIFATTHSQECIDSAHAAFSKRPDYDFSIVQLFRVQDGVQGKVLDPKHIEAAIAGEIDLR